MLETSKIKVLAELIKAVWRGNSCSVGAAIRYLRPACQPLEKTQQATGPS